MKTYTFKTINNTSNNNKGTFFFNTNTPNYSKIMDDLIAIDVMKENAHLFDAVPSSTKIFTVAGNKPTIIGSTLKADDSFIKATKFLANYKTYTKKYKLPYILGKMYTLYDGTPVIFYDDEVQIGFDTYKYADFSDYSFLNSLSTAKKNIIINIYASGVSNININIL